MRHLLRSGDRPSFPLSLRLTAPSDWVGGKSPWFDQIPRVTRAQPLDRYVETGDAERSALE